jgi:hypothetical protein
MFHTEHLAIFKGMLFLGGGFTTDVCVVGRAKLASAG